MCVSLCVSESERERERELVCVCSTLPSTANSRSSLRQLIARNISLLSSPQQFFKYPSQDSKWHLHRLMLAEHALTCTYLHTVSQALTLQSRYPQLDSQQKLTFLKYMHCKTGTIPEPQSLSKLKTALHCFPNISHIKL